MAVKYEDIYKKEYDNFLGDSVTRLQQSQEQQEKALKTGYDNQGKKLEKNKNNALKQAYISKMKEERDMPSAMARQGLNGGMVESNLASINRAYINNRNSAEENYNDNKTALDVGYESDLAGIRSQYADAISTARQNAASLATTSAGQKYNIAVEEEEKAKAEEEAKKAAEEEAAAKKKAEEEAAAKKAAEAAAAAKRASLPKVNPEPEKKVNNGGGNLKDQSGLAGTSGDTQKKINSGTYKSYDYVEKWLGGTKYIYRYGITNDNKRVLLDTSKAAHQTK